jgi:uncharacterized membrane protein
MSNKFRPQVSAHWHTIRFWQTMYIYLWVFSLVGHYIEKFVFEFFHVFFNYPIATPFDTTIVPLSLPYGLGTVALIIFVVPLVKRYKLNPFSLFVLNVVVASVVEYLCAVLIVFVTGNNLFWNYNSVPLNLSGYISLGSSLIFGAVASTFIYYIYPLCQKYLGRVKDRQFNILFWVLYVSYGVDLVLYLLRL